MKCSLYEGLEAERLHFFLISHREVNSKKILINL